MSETLSKRVVLARPIQGMPAVEDFRIETAPLPALDEGKFLARVFLVSVDPGTRSRLSGAASYAGALAIGDTVDGFAMAEIIQSRHPHYAEGQVITIGAGWAEHVISDGRGYCAPISDNRLPWSHWIGVLGVPGMTAYFGLRRVAEMKPGSTVLVTSAAGPVGATAGQLARLWGASRVVGVAGRPDKCAWLRDVCKFDVVIDRHTTSDMAAALKEAAPKGYDVFFDNVGNAMIEMVLPQMRFGGRIVVSGQVADYNLAGDAIPPIRTTIPFITKRVRMEGLVVFDDLKGFPAAQNEVADMILGNALALQEEIFDGIEAVPRAFCGLFKGENTGRRLVRLGPDPAL